MQCKRRKGIEELHSVLQQLIKENQQFEFHFIGPIPESKRLTSTRLLAYSPTSLISPSHTPWPPKGGTHPASKAPTDLLTYSPTRLTTSATAPRFNDVGKTSLSFYYRSAAAPRLTYKPANLQTYRPKYLITYQTNNLPIYRPNDLITYHGSIQDEKEIQHILRHSDALVCPSWSEGMPTVILEAMASGCAIIASDVGAVSEQVSKENGILIEPGNKKELKHAMETMLNLDNEQLLEMKKKSVEIIKEKFLWEQVAERTIEAIRQVGQ